MRRILTTVWLAAALVAAGCAGDDGTSSGVPNVRGLNLPDAEKQLKRVGYGTSVTSDGMFGVIVKQNFTVCDQEKPNGHLVPLKVAKHGC
jgi:hypothetical protein